MFQAIKYPVLVQFVRCQWRISIRHLERAARNEITGEITTDLKRIAMNYHFAYPRGGAPFRRGMAGLAAWPHLSRLDTLAAQAGNANPGFRFTDVTAQAGIQFQHNSGAFGGKFLPERLRVRRSSGSGCRTCCRSSERTPPPATPRNCPSHWP